MLKANIGLTNQQVSEVVQLLNKTLTDEVVLYSKTRNYHWNVTGSNFGQLHKLFEDQYNEIAELAIQLQSEQDNLVILLSEHQVGS